MRSVIILLSVLTLLSCSNNGKTKIGEYVYIDTKGIMHTDDGCTAVSKIKGGGQPVKLLETVVITEKDLECICSQCVKREQIDAIRLWLAAKEILDEEAEEKAEEDYNNHSLGFQIRQWLYIKLDGNTDDVESWYNFNERLQDETQRMTIYNTAKRKLIGLPEYSQFCEDLNKYREDEVDQIFFVEVVDTSEIEHNKN